MISPLLVERISVADARRVGPAKKPRGRSQPELDPRVHAHFRVIPRFSRLHLKHTAYATNHPAQENAAAFTAEASSTCGHKFWSQSRCKHGLNRGQGPSASLLRFFVEALTGGLYLSFGNYISTQRACSAFRAFCRRSAFFIGSDSAGAG